MVKINILLQVVILQILMLIGVRSMSIPCINGISNKNATDISRISTYILPENEEIVHGVGTLYKVQDFVNIIYENISNHTTCRDVRIHRQSPYAINNHVSNSATCPYFFRRNIDINRIPVTITEAKCACPCCGTARRCNRRQPKCREIYRYAEVLRRYNVLGHYMKIIEPISIGCTCVSPLPRRTRHHRFHMPDN